MTSAAQHPASFAEHDVVVSLVNLPAEPGRQAVKVGDVGTITCIADKPDLAYLVEFCDDEGDLQAWPFMQPEQIAPWTPPKAKKAADLAKAPVSL